jgi:hypothetical protein
MLDVMGLYQSASQYTDAARRLHLVIVYAFLEAALGEAVAILSRLLAFYDTGEWPSHAST